MWTPHPSRSDWPELVQDEKITLIDFPQIVYNNHPNAEDEDATPKGGTPRKSTPTPEVEGPAVG